MPETPIACTLAADDYADRLAAMRRLGADALVDARSADGHAELRFAADVGVADRLRAIAAAEAHCCPFLELRVAADERAVRLTIDGSADAAFVVDELVGAFRG